MSSVDPEKTVSGPTEPIGTPMTAEAAVSQPQNTLDRVETRASILYDSISLQKKCMIVFACSWSTLAACFSSTSLLSASKEISEDLNTTSQVVTFSTACLILAMGISALIWSPIANVSCVHCGSSRYEANRSDNRSKISIHRMHHCASWIYHWRCSCTDYRDLCRYACVVRLPGLFLPCRWADHHRRVLSSRAAGKSERVLSCWHGRGSSSRYVISRTN